jgi:hypothetical protein
MDRLGETGTRGTRGCLNKRVRKRKWTNFRDLKIKQSHSLVLGHDSAIVIDYESGTWSGHVFWNGNGTVRHDDDHHEGCLVVAIWTVVNRSVKRVTG